MKRLAAALAWWVLCLGTIPGQEVFPEREAANRQAEAFFEQVQLRTPSVRQLETLVKGKNYLSAFLNLSEALAGDPDILRLADRLEETRFELIQRFAAEAEGLSPGSETAIAERLGLSSPLTAALLTVHSLVRKHRQNKLTGALAMRHWLTLLQLIRRSARPRLPDAAAAGLMELGGRIGFFKKSPKWKKKAGRFFRSRPGARTGDPDLQLLAAAPKES